MLMRDFNRDGRPSKSRTCRDCGLTEHVTNSHSTKALPPEVVDKIFRIKGWEIRGTKNYCPVCLAKRLQRKKTDPMIEALLNHPAMTPVAIKAPTIRTQEPSVVETPQPKENVMPAEVHSLADLGQATAAKMDRPTRRRVFNAINDVWDEDRGRYIGNNSDQYVAEDLKVPRDWVVQVRIENFGDTGTNDDMVSFHAELAAKIEVADKMTADALRLAAAFEVIGNDLKAMRKRLERIEVAVLPRR